MKTRLQYSVEKLFEKLNLKKLAEDLTPYLNLTSGGTGDMTKAVYDTNDDGIVDAADTATSATTATTADNATTIGAGGYAVGTLTTTQFLYMDGATIKSQVLAGGGDMLKATYDADADNIVDNSEQLGGQAGSYYLARANHTGTQTATSISDFDEAAQDAVGTIMTDTTTIDFTYTDATPSITASVKTASITEAMQVLADNTTNDVSTSAHGYAPKAPNDTTKFLRGDASWAVPSAGETFTYVVKTSDEQKTNNNTLANDNTLVFTTTANKTYVIEYMIMMTSDGAADMKWDWTHSGTTTSSWFAYQRDSKNSTTQAQSGSTGDALGTTFTWAVTSGAMYAMLKAQIQLVVGASGGTMGFRWAQNTQNGAAMTVHGGSWLRYKQLN